MKQEPNRVGLRLRPIPTNAVVHTPTKAEATELFAILHENGYEWAGGTYLTRATNWNNYEAETCYKIGANKKVLFYCYEGWFEDNGYTILTLAEFKERYCEEEKPQPKFAAGDKVYKTSGYCRLDKYTVKKAYMDERGHWKYDLQGLIGIIGVEENDLCVTNQNPYTKLETKPTEDMETKDYPPYLDRPKTVVETPKKELNLCELLKGHEGDNTNEDKLKKIWIKIQAENLSSKVEINLGDSQYCLNFQENEAKVELLVGHSSVNVNVETLKK